MAEKIEKGSQPEGSEKKERVTLENQLRKVRELEQVMTEYLTVIDEAEAKGIDLEGINMSMEPNMVMSENSSAMLAVYESVSQVRHRIEQARKRIANAEKDKE